MVGGVSGALAMAWDIRTVGIMAVSCRWLFGATYVISTYGNRISLLESVSSNVPNSLGCSVLSPQTSQVEVNRKVSSFY